MDSRDILNTAIALGFLVFTGTAAFAFYRLARVFKALETLVEDIEDTTKDVKLLKDKLKSSSLSLVALLLKGLLKKGSKGVI